MPSLMIFVGYPHGSPRAARIVRAESIPTFESHGADYAACVGPFVTVSAAACMIRYGFMNPHMRTVAEAESFARANPELARKAKAECNRMAEVVS